MGTISDLIPIEKYKNLPKDFSGNLVTSDYRTTTANLKRFDIFLPEPPITDEESPKYGIIPPVLLPAGLSKEDLLGARVFYYESIYSDWGGKNTIMPAVGICAAMYPYATELPNIYHIYCGFNDDNPVYDSETGVLIPGSMSDYADLFLGGGPYTPEDYKAVLAVIRDLLTDTSNVPKINAELTTDEEQHIHATVTFNIPAREVYNALICKATCRTDDGQYVVTDEFTTSFLDAGTRKVPFGPGSIRLWIQSPDNPIVKIEVGSSVITLVKIDDEGKVFSTEAS